MVLAVGEVVGLTAVDVRTVVPATVLSNRDVSRSGAFWVARRDGVTAFNNVDVPDSPALVVRVDSYGVGELTDCGLSDDVERDKREQDADDGAEGNLDVVHSSKFMGSSPSSFL